MRAGSTGWPIADEVCAGVECWLATSKIATASVPSPTGRIICSSSGADRSCGAGTRTVLDGRRCLVERFDGEARGGFVDGHEFAALVGRDHIVDIVERAAAAFIDHVEQPERPGAAVAQDHLRDRAAELLVVGGAPPA